MSSRDVWERPPHRLSTS